MGIHHDDLSEANIFNKNDLSRLAIIDWGRISWGVKDIYFPPMIKNNKKDTRLIDGMDDFLKSNKDSSFRLHFYNEIKKHLKGLVPNTINNTKKSKSFNEIYSLATGLILLKNLGIINNNSDYDLTDIFPTNLTENDCVCLDNCEYESIGERVKSKFSSKNLKKCNVNKIFCRNKKTKKRIARDYCNQN